MSSPPAYDEYASLRYSFRRLLKEKWEGKEPMWAKIHIGICLSTLDCSGCILSMDDPKKDCTDEAKRLYLKIWSKTI